MCFQSTILYCIYNCLRVQKKGERLLFLFVNHDYRFTFRNSPSKYSNSISQHGGIASSFGNLRRLISTIGMALYK